MWRPRNGGDAGPDDRELNHDEIRYLVGLFAQAAQRTKAAGFDAVEIHACHGCIISEFLSPYWNQRDDEFGRDQTGSFPVCPGDPGRGQGRVGPDYPVIFRISASEFDPEGFSEDDGVASARHWNRAGLRPSIYPAGWATKTISGSRRTAYPEAFCCLWANELNNTFPFR